MKSIEAKAKEYVIQSFFAGHWNDETIETSIVEAKEQRY